MLLDNTKLYQYIPSMRKSFLYNNLHSLFEDNYSEVCNLLLSRHPNIEPGSIKVWKQNQHPQSLAARPHPSVTPMGKRRKRGDIIRSAYEITMRTFRDWTDWTAKGEETRERRYPIQFPLLELPLACDFPKTEVGSTPSHFTAPLLRRRVFY